MKVKELAIGLTLLMGLAWSAGCVKSLDGRSHFGVPLKDHVEARYERTPLEIWQAAKDVLSYNGTLYSEDTLKSTLEASINQRTVWVQVTQIDPKVTRVVIQARTKFGGTDVELAGEIDKQIAIRLASGNLTPFTPRPSAVR